MFRQFLLSLCLILLGTAGAVAGATAGPPDTFPMAKGTYWVYAGKVSWQKGSEISRAVVNWKMEVTDTVVREHVTAAILKGHPRDLAWYEPDKQRGDYLLIRVDGKGYYLVGDPQSTGVLKRLNDPSDNLSGLVGDGDLFLVSPVRVGKRFGEPAQLTRGDGMYSWHVEAQRPFRWSGVKGLPPGAKATEYVIAYRTNPDHTMVGFVPGVGITSYVYGHHGTVSEADLRLVEFHAPSPGPAR